MTKKKEFITWLINDSQMHGNLKSVVLDYYRQYSMLEANTSFKNRIKNKLISFIKKL